MSDVLSSSKNTNIDTFQGSCLGPLLFNILALHLLNSVDWFKVVITRFADDTQTGVTGPRALFRLLFYIVLSVSLYTIS